MAAPFQDCAVLFGDSITSQQYVPDSMHARFAAAYRRTLDILNRGYGGYNTRWARQVFDVVFAKQGAAGVPVVRLVTLWFGANDASRPGLTPDQHVPLPEYVAHLRWFLENLTDAERGYAVAAEPGLNIVLVTPPPVYPAMMDSGLAGTREAETVAAYADAVRSLGEEFKAKETPGGNWRIATVDMHAAVLRAAGGQCDALKEYLTDGLHLTTAGYGVFWDEYTRAVRTTFKGRGLDWEDAQDLPLRLPAWDTIDTANPDVLSGMRLPRIRQA